MRLLSFSILANTPIDQIDAELIDTIKFQRPVIDRSSGRETDELVDCGKTYSQQALRTLRVMLGQAHTWKVIKNKVSFSIAKTPGRDETITPEIEAVILRELSGYRTKRPWLVIITLQDAGCRPSEVFAMRLENIDWAGRRIKIPDGKSDNAKRWVGMSERMHRELSTWCHGSEGPGWLFPSRTSGSKHGHLNSIAHSFKAACIRAGPDPKLVPYLSRHTFGTTAMRETGNVFQVMKAMGHASVLSMQPYQHREVDQLTDVMLDLREIRIGIAVVDQSIQKLRSLPDGLHAFVQARILFLFLQDISDRLSLMVLPIEFGDTRSRGRIVLAKLGLALALLVTADEKFVPLLHICKRLYRVVR